MSFTDMAGRDLGPSLDRWITGNYGEDQNTSEEECRTCDCFKNNICVHGNSPYHMEEMDDEDWCDYWVLSSYDPRDDEPQDLDEWREERDDFIIHNEGNTGGY